MINKTIQDCDFHEADEIYQALLTMWLRNVADGDQNGAEQELLNTARVDWFNQRESQRRQ